MLKNNEHGFRGVHAAQGVKKGKTIVFVPSKWVITPGSAMKESKLCKKLIKKKDVKK